MRFKNSPLKFISRGYLSLAFLAFGFLIIPLISTASFYDFYTVPKWITLYFVTLCFLTGTLLFYKHISFPKIPNLIQLLLFILLLSVLLSIGINFPGNYMEQILDWLCFVVLFLGAFSLGGDINRFIRLALIFNFIATAIVCSYGIFQLLFSSFSLAGISSLFGYHNMTAEFLAVSIILQLFSFLEFKEKRLHIFVTFLLSASLFYLIILSSRAAYIGTLIVAALIIYLYSGYVLKKTIPVLLLLGIFLVSFFVIRPMALKSSYVSDEFRYVKTISRDIREIRWSNTLCMIKNRPFGVGPGNYEFGYVPYDNCVAQDPESNETMVVRSPHNGYLEAAAEMGVLSLILLIIILCWFFLQIIKQFKKSDNAILVPLACSVLLYTIIDALFAFPMENAYPFYVASIFSGLGLSAISEAKKISINWLYFALFPILILSLLKINSKYVEANFTNNYSRVAFACDTFPDNWRVCLNKAELEYKFQDLKKSEKTLNGVLKRSEFNFPAIKQLGLVYLSQGRIDEACRYLIKYDQLFNAHSSVHSQLESSCIQ